MSVGDTGGKVHGGTPQPCSRLAQGAAPARSQTVGARSWSSTLGNASQNVEPVPGPSDSAHVVPPIASARALAMANPMPDPPSARERDGSSFYAYDVEKDSAEPFALGKRKAINEILWLGNDRCAVLVNGDTIHLFDRKQNKFSELIKLIIASNKMLGASPGGKRFFCGNRKGAMLIDVEGKTAELFPHPAENMEWLSDDSLIYACGLPNSAVRGTWFLRIGAEPVRITEEPYIFTRDGKMCGAVLKTPGLLAFGTPGGLCRIGLDGTKFEEVKQWRTAASTMTGLERWDP